MGYIKQYGKNAGFLPAFGLYSIEDKGIPVSTMYDKAMVVLASVKGNYARCVCRYDGRMMGRGRVSAGGMMKPVIWSTGCSAKMDISGL